MPRNPSSTEARISFTGKQYEQQEMKSNSVLFGTPLLKAQNEKI